MTDSWVVLRCSGSSTLKLADSLREAGFECWTPVETVKRRQPRKPSARPATVAVMPSFVFADAGQLRTLLTLAKAYNNPHPSFSVFRYYSRFPVIADGALDALRIAERRGTPVEQAAPLKPGELVRYPEAGLQGLSGRVVRTRNKGRMALVAFGSMQIEIESLLLLPGNPQEQREAA